MENLKKEVKKQFAELKKGTKQMFKEFFKKETHKKQRANMWTFTRLAITPIFPILTIAYLINGGTLTLIIMTLLALFGASTDYFDGKSARKHNSFSEFGKNLDPIADKFFYGTLGICLVPLKPLFLIPLLGEAAIAGTNAYYKSNYPEMDIKSSKIGKIKQWPLSVAFILGLLSLLIKFLAPVVGFLIQGTLILQLITLANYIKKNNDAVKEIERNQEENEEIEQNELEHTQERTLSRERTLESPRIRTVQEALDNNQIERKKYNVKRRVLKRK